MEIDIVSPLSAAEVTVRLHARGREWRESLLPPAVRAAGFTGVRVAITGDRFTVKFKGGPRGPYFPQCDGRVVRAATGSRLTARIRPTTGTVVWGSLMLLWHSFLSLSTHDVGFWLLGVALLAGAYAWGFARSAPWRAGLIDVVQSAAPPPEQGRGE